MHEELLNSQWESSKISSSGSSPGSSSDEPSVSHGDFKDGQPPPKRQNLDVKPIIKQRSQSQLSTFSSANALSAFVNGRTQSNDNKQANTEVEDVVAGREESKSSGRSTEKHDAQSGEQDRTVSKCAEHKIAECADN